MNKKEVTEMITGHCAGVASTQENGLVATKVYIDDLADELVNLFYIHRVSKSLNMKHNATSVEYAEAIIDMHKNPENSNRDFKIVVLENTIDKLKQDLANI